jgi:hypothetical protein
MSTVDIVSTIKYSKEVQMGYIAFVLSEQSREDIKKLFPSKYEREVCHHVTLVFGDTSEEARMMAGMDAGYGAYITGHYDDKQGVECLSVSFAMERGDGTFSLCNTRRDGQKYHITHSLTTDRKPVESNNVVGKPEYQTRLITLEISGTIEVID